MTRDPAPLALNFYGDTSSDFQHKVREALETIPLALLERLTTAGVRVSGAEWVSTAGIQGFDANGGAYRNGHAVVAEKKELALGRFILNRNPIGTLYHEIGHATYDRLLTGKQRLNLARFSRADAMALPFEHHERMHAFLNNPRTQPREAFAEAFAGHLGSQSAGYEDFATWFPRTAAFVADIIRNPEAHDEIVYHHPPE